VSYPCPNCNSPASPQTGCPGCGRGPDADAVEMVRLDAEIADLNAKLAYARQAVRDIPPLIEGAWVRRNAAATRVRAARARSTAPVPGPAFPQPPAAGPAVRLSPAPARVRGPEASTKLVQNLLFLLGGLLLAVAAIVFTAVAWAQFGVGGRAALLAFFTGVALAVPPVALRRKLSATAETFAAVGLLLALLDGYAAWYVNLFGVADGSPWGYAGAVCAVSAAVAAGYEHVTGLTGPRFAALVVAQPVVPLLVVPTHPGATGWALAFAAVGAIDVAVLALRRTRFQFAGVGIAAYVCGAASIMIAGCCALAGLITAETPATAATAGGALLAPALVVLVATVLARNATAQAVAGGLAVVALDVAGIGFTLRVGSGSGLLRVAVVTFVVVALATAARRLLPPIVARGPRAGALAVITVPALAVLALAAEAAVETLDTAQPFLGAGWSTTVPYAGWALLVSIPLLAAALLLTAPAPRRGDIALAAAVLTALVLPATLHLPWWSAPIFDLAVVPAALALAIRYLAPAAQPVPTRSVPAGQPPSASGFPAARPASTRSVSAGQPPSTSGFPAAQLAAAPVGASPAALVDAASQFLTAPATAYAGAARTVSRPASVPLTGPAFSFGAQILAVVLLGLHAVTAGFGRAGVAAGVLGAVALFGLATAVLTHAGPRRRDLGGAGLLTALLAAPAIAWTTTAALSASERLQTRIVLAAVAPLVAALWAITRRAPGYRPFALSAVLLAAIAAPAWALASGDSPALYAAVALVLLALTLLGTSSAPSASPVVDPPVVGNSAPGSSAPGSSAPGSSAVGSSAVGSSAVGSSALGSSAVGSSALGSLVPGSSTVALTTELGWTAVAAVPLGLTLFVAAGRSLFRVFLEPYHWLGAIWAGRPTDLPHVPAVDAIALVVAGLAAALVGYLLPTGPDRGVLSGTLRGRAAAWTAVPVLAVALPVVLAAARAPWPVVPGVQLALGLAGLLCAALRRTPISFPVVGALLAGPALAGALPTHGSTLAALGAVLITAAVAGSSGRTEPIRVAGWILATATAFGLAGTAGDALELNLRVVAFLVLGTAAVAFALGWLLSTHLPAPARGGRRLGEGRAVEAAAHAGAALALLLTVGSLRHTAAVCVLWGAALGIRALGVPAPTATASPRVRTQTASPSPAPALPAEASVPAAAPAAAAVPVPVPAEAAVPVPATAALPAAAAAALPAEAAVPVTVSRSAGDPTVSEPGDRSAASAVRHAYVVAAAVAEFAGWCLLMAASNVSTVEVYTIPAAVVALLAGVLARLRQPRLSSWTAYGPALAAALLPSLATVAGAEDQYLRRLLLGLAALAIVVAGANARLKAPVVMGGAALTLVALHELAQVWDLIPRWIPLAAGGLLLVLLAMTLERRRRDLARFRAALTRMT
jgi:hypothetical protein